jgi:hypothetical protein
MVGAEEDGLETLESVLETTAENEWKDFEFIVEIERRISDVLRSLGRVNEADEIDRRIASVTEVIED